MLVSPAQADGADGLVRDFPLVTNVAQLRQAVGGNTGCLCSFLLEGTVLAADSVSGIVFFQDDSGAEVLETTLEQAPLQAGQRIQLRGTNFVVATEMGLSLGKRPVVENDGLHSEIECNGTLYMKAGRYPLQVLWFNCSRDRSLSLAFEGPNRARRIVPDSALFRLEKPSARGGMRFVNGLNYRCFEGRWLKLPPFQALTPVKTGVASNFDLAVATRDEYVGLAFDGFIQVESDGVYTFYLTSDDGSQLFLQNGPTQLTVLSSGDVPAPRRIAIRQPSFGSQKAFWAEAEGCVTFLGMQPNGVEVELTSEDTHMRFLVCDPQEQPPRHLLGSRVRVRGVCLDTANIEGHTLADMLVVPNWKSVQVLELAPELWSSGVSLRVSDAKKMEPQASRIVRIGGRVSQPLGQGPVLEDATGSVPIELLNLVPTSPDLEVECLGRWSGSGSNCVLREAVWREWPNTSESTNQALPLLTTAAQVQQLKREEAKLAYKVKIRGVVTWVAENRDCVVLQDATRGVFVGLRIAWVWGAPRIGENLEIEGTTIAGDFSPIVVLEKANRLGMGTLPPPMQPTWDQLIGGSMDSQYVEVRGLVTGAHENHLTLLMSGGPLEIEFVPYPADPPLESLVNSVVRIRGCMFAKWDNTTLQVTPDHPLRFGSSTICVDAPAPLDPFDAVKMRARELMRFDAQGNIFRRVKIAGQVVHGSAQEYYLAEDGFGMRFQLAQPANFKPGDEVEVAGLVEVRGASPVLREAIARNTGHSSLPAPEPLNLERNDKSNDATRVWVEGLLVGAKDTGPNRVLEMQVGLKSFVARLAATNGNPVVLWPLGSRLKLTGVYADLGGAIRRARAPIPLSCC